MPKSRASFFGLCFMLCAALPLLSACGASTNEGESSNNSTTRAHTEARTSPSAAANVTEEAVPLSAMAILDDFDRDPSAADRKYKGRTLTISGVVAATGKSKAGVPFVSFQRPGAISPAGTMVVCNLTPDHEAAVRTLEKGREVKLSGRVQGTLTGNVLLENCVLRH